ncbi:Aste57867_2663 [Aphanomyces stellatus]|uniref:Aste57867_2663 protein n=1 Tax=Aphanomyces stellatus TaxID=120398 RepID=A0A485KCB5_9STRA|nr:hypothetical protein As57867_002656 [Aphanomyces stellatus]VFT79857.1 Aste57867_2663 [Aphanomyces stellatus]
MLRDECKLLLVLPLHAVCFAPAILLPPPSTASTILLLYVLFVAAAAVFSTSSVCQERWRIRQMHVCWLAWLYTGLQAALIAVDLLSLCRFLSPFLSNAPFHDNCNASAALRGNAAGYSCAGMQQAAAVALVLLTAAIGLGIYLLVLGKRVAKKQYIEYARVKKEIERHQSMSEMRNTSAADSPSSDSLLTQA